MFLLWFWTDILGPLTYNSNGEIVVVGVTSWRRAFDKNNKPLLSKEICKQHGTYSVFAQVAAQLQWINEEIKNPICKHRSKFFSMEYLYWILLSIAKWFFFFTFYFRSRWSTKKRRTKSTQISMCLVVVRNCRMVEMCKYQISVCEVQSQKYGGAVLIL